jgi:hypothetical protein
MFLTSPYIDQAVTLKTPRLSINECNRGNNAKMAPFQAFLTLPPGWFGRGRISSPFYAAFRPLFSGAGR